MKGLHENAHFWATFVPVPFRISSRNEKLLPLPYSFHHFFHLDLQALFRTAVFHLDCLISHNTDRQNFSLKMSELILGYMQTVGKLKLKGLRISKKAQRQTIQYFHVYIFNLHSVLKMKASFVAIFLHNKTIHAIIGRYYPGNGIQSSSGNKCLVHKISSSG